MPPFDSNPAAALIADAWKSGRQLTELPEAVRPSDLGQAYDLQDRMVAAMGEPLGGWKLGVGSPASLRSTGLKAPLVGRLLKNRIHPNGARVKLPGTAPVTVEFEIAFVIGQDVAPGARPADPLAAVSEIRATFELVLSRFVDRRAVGWPSFAADSVGFAALIVGDPMPRESMKDVPGSVAISVDGAPRVGGLVGDELTEPRQSFDFLLAHAAERGQTLRRGEIATLGAIGKPFDIVSGAVEARYLGSRLAFTLERG